MIHETIAKVIDGKVEAKNAVKYEIWWQGPKGKELVDEFDNEATAKASVRDYEMAFKAKPGSITVKKVTF